MDKKLYIVAWEGRDGDGSALIRTDKGELAAILACCDETQKVLRMDFDTIHDGYYYIPKSMADTDLQPAHNPLDKHGVFIVSATEAEIIEA